MSEKTSKAWDAIIYLNTRCSEIDRPFFEALMHGKLLEALQVLETIAQFTPMIKDNLEGIIVSACASRPGDEVERWFNMRDAIITRGNIYGQCVIEAVRYQNLDTAKYVCQIGLTKHAISDNEKSSIVAAAIKTKNLDVVDVVRHMLGEVWNEKFLTMLMLTGQLPLNDDLFCFVNKTVTPEHISKAEAAFHQSKTRVIFGPSEDEIEYGQAFWDGLKTYQQRMVLRQEIEQAQEMGATAPKSKM